jgi:hypothetical protein
VAATDDQTGTAYVLSGDGGELAECLSRRLRAAGAVVTADAAEAQACPAVRTVTFGDAAAGAEGWIVTRGAAPFGWSSPSATWADAVRRRPTARLVDLDPSQSSERQAAILAAALCDADELPAAYRGDQRYVPQALLTAEAPKAAAGATFDRAALRAAPPAERRALLEDFLRREFAAVAGVRLSADDMAKPLNAFGLDSLMAMQLRNRVEVGLGISLSLVRVLRGLSMKELVDEALQDLPAATPEPAAPAPDLARWDGLEAGQVDALAADDLDSLLHSLLAHPAPALSGSHRP